MNKGFTLFFAILAVCSVISLLPIYLERRDLSVGESAVQSYKDSHQVYVGYSSHGTVCVRSREFELIELHAKAGELVAIDTGYACKPTTDNSF